MHLGVVKVGLLGLAKPEVFCQRIIFTTTKNSMLDNLSSNFDNPYYNAVVLFCFDCTHWKLQNLKRFLLNCKYFFWFGFWYASQFPWQTLVCRMSGFETFKPELYVHVPVRNCKKKNISVIVLFHWSYVVWLQRKRDAALRQLFKTQHKRLCWSF